MAIFHNIPGITISVRVNDHDLREYPAPNDACKFKCKKLEKHWKQVTTTNYIETNQGDSFTIQLSVDAPYQMDCPILGFRVFVDGEWIQEPLITRTSYEEYGEMGRGGHRAGIRCRWHDLVQTDDVQVSGSQSVLPQSPYHKRA